MLKQLLVASLCCRVMSQNITRPPTSVCSPGYHQLGQWACYAWVDSKETWAGAQSVCRALGGFLAEIYTTQQNALVRQLVTSHGSTAWLGGHDLLEEGAWRWAKSGNKMADYLTDWETGQPDNYHTEEDCLEFKVDYDHWNDAVCNNKNSFICQKYSTSSPVVG